MIFQQHQKVTESGLIAYQGLCYGMGEKIPIQDIGQYIFTALQQEDDENVTKIAVGIICDIANGLGEEVAQYLSSLVPHLLQILRSKDRKQDTKLVAINSLASVACYAAISFCNNYLGDSLYIL